MGGFNIVRDKADKFEDIYFKGQFKDLLNLAEKEGINGKGLYWKMTALWRLGEFDRAIEVGFLAKEEFPTMDIKWRAKILHRIGTVYHNLAELDVSQEYYQQSLALKEIIGDEIDIADTLNNMGIIHYDKGEFDLALKYYERSLEIKIKHKSTKDIAPSLNNIAIVHRTMGELDAALSYFIRCLELNQENENQQDISYSLQNIAKIYRDKGEYEKALDYFKESLQIRIAVGNEYNTAEMYMDLIVTYVEMDQIEIAKEYLSKLDEIAKNNNNRKIAMFRNYSEALILKASKRIRDTGKAQEIFIDLIQENDFDFYLLIKTYGHLVELLIYEYKSFEEESVLQEILAYTSKMLEVANQQSMYSTQMDVLILQSRLTIIQNKFDEAHEILQEAKDIAEQKHMQFYIDQINDERENLRENLNDLKDMIENSSISSKLEQTALMDYIKIVQKARD